MHLFAAHIYLDGSAYSDDSIPLQAAWSFAVVEEYRMLAHDGAVLTQFVFAGFMSGAVIVDPSNPLFVGAMQYSPAHAEASVISMATLWLAQSSYLPHVRYTLYFDCDHVGRAAAGTQQWRDESFLPLIVRAVAQVVMYARPISWCHVKAHVGKTWNELVDGIAKAACKESLSVGPKAAALSTVIEAGETALAWMWYFSATRTSVK
jgi:ribonuclease HI